MVGYYWPQTRVFCDHGRLRQTKTGTSIPDRIARAQQTLAASGIRTPDAAHESRHPAYVGLIHSLELTVAQQPITHLQTVPHASRASASDDFMFDASLFHKKMTRSDLRRADPLLLHDGVAEALRDAAPLLKGLLRSLWTAEVSHLNRRALDREDLESFLFSGPRESLSAVAKPLIDLQSGRCFYCDKPMRQVHVDHVLPWSLIPINGLANLVASDPACNGDKSASLPAIEHLWRALERDGLEHISTETRFPILRERTRSAAGGIYSTIPVGTPLWRSVGTYSSASAVLIAEKLIAQHSAS